MIDTLYIHHIVKKLTELYHIHVLCTHEPQFTKQRIKMREMSTTYVYENIVHRISSV